MSHENLKYNFKQLLGLFEKCDYFSNLKIHLDTSKIKLEYLIIKTR